MTRKHNHDDDDDDASLSSSRKRINSFDNYRVAPWSVVNRDVLFIVMMQLGVVDFVAFSGVCKSWRSFALSNRNTFMASKLPMSIDLGLPHRNQDSCYLKDFEGRRFKTILPHSAYKLCIGVTCGYLILFGSETREFWLVNPITRHELHFPHYPFYENDGGYDTRAILVFSDSISGWVLVTLRSRSSRKRKISFCIAGKRRWNHVSCAHPVIDLHAFKGKIYTLHTDCWLRELRLNLKRKCKSTLCEINKFQTPLYSELLSSGENLYIVRQMYASADSHVLKLDFGAMKWFSQEKTCGEYSFFLSCLKSSAAIKLEFWPGPPTQNKNLNYRLKNDESQQHMFYYESMWYFPHDCLNVNLLNE